MNYSEIAEKLKQIACVVCVDLSDSDKYGTITLEAANKPYLASVNKLEEEFVAGREYTYYINRDPNFEKNCLKCVTTGKALHQYVNAELYNAWIDIYFHPLTSDDDKKGYILFSYEMNQRAESEKLLDISGSTAAYVLKTCIKLREAEDFQLAMDSIIIDIRLLCDASGCCILLTDFEERKCSVLCIDHDASFNPGNSEVIFKPEFFDIVETWRDLMAGSNCYIISDEKDFKEVEKKNEKWAKSLRNSKIKNIVLYPLRSNGILLGYLWATNFNPEKTDFIKEVLELNSFILSAEIANHNMFKKLEEMSVKDMLTGVLNRNAMNERISGLTQGKNKIRNSYGIIIVDVNGLKVVNDKEGHIAGDYYIKGVAETLKEVFSEYEVYRAGGDEFFIFLMDCEKDKFDGLIDKLRKESCNEDTVRFAIGYCYDEGPKYNIKKALHFADGQMYKDKAEYYKNNPILDRRSR